MKLKFKSMIDRLWLTKRWRSKQTRIFVLLCNVNEGNSLNFNSVTMRFNIGDLVKIFMYCLASLVLSFVWSLKLMPALNLSLLLVDVHLTLTKSIWSVTCAWVLDSHFSKIHAWGYKDFPLMVSTRNRMDNSRRYRHDPRPNERSATFKLK